MRNELGKMWNEMILDYLKIFSRYISGCHKRILIGLQVKNRKSGILISTPLFGDLVFHKNQVGCIFYTLS